MTILNLNSSQKHENIDDVVVYLYLCQKFSRKELVKIFSGDNSGFNEETTDFLKKIFDKQITHYKKLGKIGRYIHDIIHKFLPNGVPYSFESTYYIREDDVDYQKFLPCFSIKGVSSLITDNDQIEIDETYNKLGEYYVYRCFVNNNKTFLELGKSQQIELVNTVRLNVKSQLREINHVTVNTRFISIIQTNVGKYMHYLNN